MVIIIIGAWLLLLQVLVKVGVLTRWHLWMKLSPIPIYILYFLIIAIPMNFTAPKGVALVMRESVPVSPAVPGRVIEVPVASGVEVDAGSLLFILDPKPYEAQVANLEAQLKLANTRVAQARSLLERNAGRAADLQQFEAQREQMTAQLEAAKWDLAQTRVLAPRQGVVPHIALEEGTQVSPGSPVLSLIDSRRFTLVGRIDQAYVRHIEPGQKADVVLKLLPGRVLTATVNRLVPANPQGQLSPSGMAISTESWSEQPFLVDLDLELVDELPNLPAGAYGTIAIYTSDMGTIAELIRAIMLRVETWLNFL